MRQQHTHSDPRASLAATLPAAKISAMLDRLKAKADAEASAQKEPFCAVYSKHNAEFPARGLLQMQQTG